MKYFVEKMPDDDLYEGLLTGADEVDSEWATVVRLAYRAGVKAGTTRHLQRPDFQQGYVNLGHRLSKAVVRRRLPADVLESIQSLPQDQLYICPRLHEMTTRQFGRKWRVVCKAASVTVPMIALTWRYRIENRDSLRLERGMSYLEKLGKDWLKEEQVQQLWVDAKDWILLPPKRDTRGQRRTRKELLARSGGL
jgi:hypothetical protein